MHQIPALCLGAPYNRLKPQGTDMYLCIWHGNKTVLELKVIHWGPPNDIEMYIQQTGQSGRDGELSFCMAKV